MKEDIINKNQREILKNRQEQYLKMSHEVNISSVQRASEGKIKKDEYNKNN